MPSGTLIEIQITSSTRLTAFINPSVHDWRNSHGLCGFISNSCPDDFKKPDGTTATIPGFNDACSAKRIEKAQDFIQSWQVFGANNWFTLMENDNVPPSLTTSAYCTCPHAHKDEIDGHFHCGGATVDCAIAFDNVGAAQCNLLFNNQRRKRSLEYPFKTAEMKKKRKRRDVLPAEIKVNMTQEQARQYCDEFLRSSPVFDACSDIPEVNTEEYIDICALDIKLTSTLSWANQTMADLKTSCMKELRMNNTLKEPGPEGEPSVASIVKNKICDGNPPCSNNGDCVNGTCSCYDGFISPDCSVDLNIPPELIGVRGDSLCDISEIPCNLSFVIAEEIYSTEMLSCEIVEYQVSANGTYIKMDNHIAVAKHETLVEVLCPLSTGRVKRSASSKDEENFSTAFEISVSYDGVLFSEPVDMLIYDSRCQEVVNTTERIHLRLMDGFCRLDGQCFMEDEYSIINPCMKCNTKVSQYMWTKVNDIDGKISYN
ncbi:unnamed protein product [Mytilus edulis]|uniref:VWFD domain-containing protein n=1 Tax=Mytilus edulis TaxID=6550 RepID=A0A8S3UT58_MYTED|nr:unnamed protein product [Mytilus edulis]